MKPKNGKPLKKLVVISGAGGGLGRAITEAYIANGFMVVATDIKMDLLNDFQSNKNILPVKMDVRSEEDVKHCARVVNDNYGRLDVLVSNAGIFDFYPVSEAGADQLKKIFDVNVFGLANLVKYFLPLLIKSKGRLLAISSESYKVPSPFQPYSVSKQALEKVFDAIRLELMTKGIKSVIIRPGAIRTEIMERTVQFKTPIAKTVFKNEFNSFIQSVTKYIGKISSPEQVAKIVLKAGIVKKPKRIYKINHNPLVTLLSVLPGSLQEKVVIMNLHKQ